MLFKMIWVLLTIFAAFMQSWRNALQSKLSAHVSVAGVTLATLLSQALLQGCIYMRFIITKMRLSLHLILYLLAILLEPA